MQKSKSNTVTNFIKFLKTVRRYSYEENEKMEYFFGVPRDFTDKDRVTKRCLEIANKAKFPTDYQDMYEHLFENEDSELFMVMDENNEIYGFATCDNIAKSSNTYLHGIIIHPDIQEMGFSSKLLYEMVKKDGNSFLTARTHNPRVYEVMSNMAYNANTDLVFPTITHREMPKEIWDIIHSYPAMQNADKDLIVRNAYPDEKVIQEVKNKNICEIFKKLNLTDAQVIVVCTKKPKWF